MSDMAYIMETQDPRELWLVDGEQRMRVSRDMYWLLVSQGADLPPLHDISDLLAENAALHQQLADVTESMSRVEERCAKLRELARNMHMAYIGALNECEAMDAGLIWDNCDVVETELVKSHARFETDRHRFDVVMRELEVEVDEQ